jgi:hypothetical protein
LNFISISRVFATLFSEGELFLPDGKVESSLIARKGELGHKLGLKKTFDVLTNI